MQTQVSMHNKVMREYEKKQQARMQLLREKQNALYEAFPTLKTIDSKISALAVKHAARIVKEGISPEDALLAVENEKKILLAEKNAILGKDAERELEIPYECADCKDTGFVDGKKCKCYMQIMKNLIQSETDGTKSIIFDIENDTFENFDLRWYSKTAIDSKLNVSPYDNIKFVVEEAKSFCENFGSEFKNLYFCGHSGTGKTFLASCIANELVGAGFKVVYQSAYKLFQFMEDYKFCRIDRTDSEGTYNNIYNCDLLIIDDLGTEFGTAYTCSVLFDILNTRLLNKKSTIISTNLNLVNLEKKYTDRVHSRIVGNFELYRFIGDDIRILKKQSGR